MQSNTPTIAGLGFDQDQMAGETVIISGAGGGIGFEAARAFLWLGANVLIAEIDRQKGNQAEETLKAEFEPERVWFIHTDIGDEASVQNLYESALERFGKVDVVINNATIAVLGMVKDLPIEDWDASYRVNLRGPVLMAKAFLPGMIERNHGVFVCVSSTGTAFLGGYETFKAAQVHLANTLDAELEGSDVTAFTIGPGLVPTETAAKAVGQLAPQMGMSVEEFFKMNENVVLTVEEAGTGFAAAVVFAEKFRGQEISSIQAIKAADIHFGGGETRKSKPSTSEIQLDNREQAVSQCKRVRLTLKEQSNGWKKRSVFERQWVIRDFRKTAGMPVEEWLNTLERLEDELQHGGEVSDVPLEKLGNYYNHLAELAKGYEKDPIQLEENLQHVYGWRDDVNNWQPFL